MYFCTVKLFGKTVNMIVINSKEFKIGQEKCFDLALNKKRVIRILFLLLYFHFFLTPIMEAQRNNNPLRVELETAKDEHDYNCVPAEEMGIVVFYEGDLLGHDSVTWILMHYDTNLKRLNNYKVPLPANLSFAKSCYADGRIFFLFQEKQHRKNTPRSYFVCLDLRLKQTKVQIVPELSDLSINYMQVFERQIILISYEKDIYNIYMYDFSKNSLITPRLSSDKILSIEFCEADTLSQKLYWGVVSSAGNKTVSMQLIETNYQGELLGSSFFPSYTGYYLSSARFAMTDTASALIIGTYTDEQDKYSGNYYTGVYTVTFKNGIFGDPTFYTYSHIKSRDLLNVSKNKKNNQNLHELIGPLFINNGHYTFVTEVFYPEYVQQSTPSFDPYYYGSRRYSNSLVPPTVFNGFRYLNAYIIAFDKDGNLLWDNYMPFSGILTERLTQRVSIYPFQDYTVIFYPFNNRITYTMLSGYDIIEPLRTISLVTNYQRDIVEYSRNNYFTQWYGNYFIAYGYQHIRNSSKDIKKKRYVFYMNKLGYK